MTPLFSRIKVLLFIVPVILLYGCFTGIESTPKITSKDLNRENIRTTDEDRLLADIAYQPFSDWRRGKEFFVTDAKLEMALEHTSSAIPAAGAVIRFDTIREVPSVSGSHDTELLFTTDGHGTLVYHINTTPDKLAERQRVTIPFTIELSVVDSVRNRLKGKEVYIKTPTWYDVSGDHTLHGMKYVKVTIDDVVPGDLVYPTRVVFTPDTVAATDQVSIYMAADDAKSTRSFASLFSLTDPRLNYPSITDHVWDNIRHSRVEKYMTREECRLALGSPHSVRNHNVITAIEEMWLYDNGVYLIFEDGILTSFRQ